MREIKFRAKSKLTSEWVYGYYSVRGGEHFISFMNNNHQWQDVEVIPETVGQFTNLPDKNGKEVYEGDIVSFHWNGKGVSPVYWTDELGWTFHTIKVGPYHHHQNIQGMEVIGNIYENPELLEGGK